MTHQRGFTLVELVMTLVIIGILAAVVGPRFFDRQVFDERLFFEETVSAVRYAQKLALASGCDVQVSIDSLGYRLLKERDCDSKTAVPDFCETGNPEECQVFTSVGDVYEGFSSSDTQITKLGFPLAFDSLGVPRGKAETQCKKFNGNTPIACATIGAFTFNVTAETGLVQ